MGKRARAIGFASAAAVCAGLAASATGDRPAAATDYGELRDVVVAAQPLPAQRLRERDVGEALEIRRVPESFVPPGALTTPAQAVGRSPAAPIPAGSYLLASQLVSRSGDADADRPAARLDPGRRPVEIAVDAAGALASGSARRVDVIVTTEPSPGGGPGRTYVEARAVGLLDLRSIAGDSGIADVAPGPATEGWVATLALTRGEALRLIQAESFARSVRLIAR